MISASQRPLPDNTHNWHVPDMIRTRNLSRRAAAGPTSYLLIDPLNAKLNPICHLLALLGAHHILYVSIIRVKRHFNPLNAELNRICHLLALLGAHHILHVSIIRVKRHFNPLNTELNPICHLLALLGAHHILHISGIRVNITPIYLALRPATITLRQCQ